ncbi:MAG: hypothetical protein ACK5OC_01485 [Pirellula sp.]
MKSPGKTLGKSNGGNAGGNISSDLAELMALWPKLSREIRNQCLKLARHGLEGGRQVVLYGFPTPANTRRTNSLHYVLWLMFLFLLGDLVNA